MPKIATCPSDGSVLVSTMLFSKAEFYCLECGGHWGWLDPRPAEETPELIAACDAAKAEFDTLAAGAIAPNSWHRDCPACSPRGEHHIDHVSSLELAASAQAYDRLSLRKRLPA